MLATGGKNVGGFLLAMLIVFAFCYLLIRAGVSAPDSGDS